MKRIWYSVLIFLSIGVLAVGIFTTRNHLWTQSNAVKVFYDGEQASDSTVYVSVDEDLLVWVKNGDTKLGVYCILFRDRRVGKPYRMELLTALPWSYLVRNYPLENIVDIGTEKSYPYAETRFEEDRVTFSLEENKKFEIKF
ncbi:MAG: hypothetical protein WBD22_06615 [Pyrinomonadaceae bacterium]